MFFVSGKVMFKLNAGINLIESLIGMFLCVPEFDLISLIFMDFVEGKPLSCLACFSVVGEVFSDFFEGDELFWLLLMLRVIGGKVDRIGGEDQVDFWIKEE